MAKVTAPLLGFGASGSIAKTVVYGSWRGISYARRHVIPSNPQSTAQTLTRDTFATLREMWKRAGPLTQAPWDAFARGRPFTGLNSWVGENMRLVRGELDFNLFIGSPGAGGGLAFPTMVLADGTASGDIQATLTAPTLPTGWTVTKGVAMGFTQQAPDAIFVGPMVEASDAATPFVINLAGFASLADVVVSGWFEYVKPNGDTAYSVGITDAGTAKV